MSEHVEKTIQAVEEKIRQYEAFINALLELDGQPPRYGGPLRSQPKPSPEETLTRQTKPNVIREPRTRAAAAKRTGGGAPPALRGEVTEKVAAAVTGTTRDFTEQDISKKCGGGDVRYALMKMVGRGEVVVIQKGRPHFPAVYARAKSISAAAPAPAPKASRPMTLPAFKESEMAMAMRGVIGALKGEEFTTRNVVDQLRSKEGNHKVALWLNAGSIAAQMQQWRDKGLVELVRREGQENTAIYKAKPEILAEVVSNE